MKNEIESNMERIRRMADRLRDINREMKRLLDRIPLTDHRDVLRLSQLSEQQLALLREHIGPASPRATAFLDNARHSAIHLRRKYVDALQKGKLRKSGEP